MSVMQAGQKSYGGGISITYAEGAWFKAKLLVDICSPEYLQGSTYADSDS